MHKVQIDHIKINVPGSYDELTRGQFVQCIAAQRLSNKRRAELQLTKNLLGVHWTKPALWGRWWYGIGAEDRVFLKTLSKPFMQPGKMSSTPMAYLKSGRKKLYAIHPDLLNEIDAKTWGLANGWFIRWQQSQKREALEALAACLYTPKGMSTEQRLRAEHLPMLKKVSSNELLAVASTFKAHRLVYRTESPLAFAGKKERGKSMVGGFDKFLVGISGGPFGPYKDTASTPARLVLMEMHNMRKREKNRKQKRNG